MKYYFFLIWSLALSACASANKDSSVNEFPFLRFEYDVIVIQWESNSDLDPSKMRNGIIVFDYRGKGVEVGFAELTDPFMGTPFNQISINDKHEASRLDLFAWNSGYDALKGDKSDLFSNNLLGWSSRVVFEFYSENQTAVREEFEFVGSAAFIEEFIEKIQYSEKLKAGQTN